MKSPPVLKKINGSYHRRLLPTEILQNGDVYSAGRDIGTSFIGKPANHSIAYPLETYLWRPTPQIEGYRQLDLSDDIDEQAKFVIITPQGWSDAEHEALKNIHRFSAIDDVLFYAKIEPKIATGHNPDNLTEEQVGAGYRLLLPSEIGFRKATSEIQLWRISEARWIESSYNGDTAEFTYRVRNGVKLAPAKAAPASDASAPTTEVGTNERLKKLEEAVEALKFTVELQAKAIMSLQGRLDKGGRALKG